MIEEQTFLLEERKEFRDSFHKQWERLFSEIKPAVESETLVALKVADEFYQPVLDAIWRVDAYADVFRTMEECLAAAKAVLDSGKRPEGLSTTVRNALESNPDPKELIQSMQDALPNCAIYLCRQLDDFYHAIARLISSGYFSELEASAGRDNLKKILNCFNAADLPTIIASKSPEDVSKFLKEWKSGELDPLRKLREDVPWHKFFASYTQKLRLALRQTQDIDN